ncbi:hypothetical protein UFOVP58_45 [uncultured Caudovirales phage]|uniref:Uncharacterized protein n=1 Tax=uncultured Caudovirales phage TaxID=2100421 RepID=A0A6J5KUZ5_9CAUD|nr:hypothetical protein UFOVP58_45 [uncultured Caudovirales phage]
MATRLFECDQCDAYGKITVKEFEASQIVCCPCCGSDISQVDEATDDE